MIGKISLYTALTTAVMTTLLLMTFVILQYAPYSGFGGALLIRTPKLTTEVWGVFNPQTGEVRYGSNVEAVRPIASITKLFVAYAVLETKSENASTTITWGDLNTNGDAGKLSYGERYTLRELLFPLLIESSNDAGVTISRVMGSAYTGSLEALLTTEGLTDTSIIDSTGLSSANVSSVRDLAQFYTHLRTKHPHILDITQLRMYITNSTGLINNNPVRSLSSFTGGKHGYTPEAGRTFVGTVTLPNNRGEIGIVLLGSSDLVHDVTQIIESFY
jgi:D-alanyl-D-alanine carboxypeptidase